MSTSESTQWWLQIDGATHGPFSQAYVALRLQSGTLSEQTPACLVGQDLWRPIGEWLDNSSAKAIPLTAHPSEQPLSHPLPPPAHTHSPTPPQTVRSSISPPLLISIGAGVGILFSILFACVICCGLVGWEPTTPTDSTDEIRRQLIAELDSILNKNRQSIFNALHPVGQAQRVEVHDCSIDAGPGGTPILMVRYTLYWKGPITTDGFTKVLHTYDLESQRDLNVEILSTNGTTNEEAGQMAIDFAAGMMEELIRQEMANRQTQSNW